MRFELAVALDTRALIDAQARPCSKCGITKPFGDFNKSAKEKLGIRSVCRECQTEQGRAHYAANIESERLRSKENHARDPSVAARRGKAWFEKNKQHTYAVKKIWRDANPEKRSAISRRSYTRQAEIPAFRLNAAIRASLNAKLKDSKKGGRKSFDLLGYTPGELAAHLECLFLPGMTWANYGDWHIDHIIPLSAHNFDAPEDIDFKRAWALANLQPLWAADNLSKGAKLTLPFQPSLALAA